MSAGHAGTNVLHHPGDSPVHRLPPQVKIVAALLTVIGVVATPREEFWAFGGYLVLVVTVWRMARVPVSHFAKRALIEVPFVVIALLMPLLGGAAGALAGWNILAKGTLGVLTSLTLAATTTPRELIVGLQRLRTPAMLTTIATLMLRYLEVIAAEARRMRLARISRGHDPRFLWQVGATARGIGALFIRSYERGERVHLAMVSRGWRGAMPDRGVAASPATWLAGLTPVLVTAAVLGTAVLVP
ncbi:cobalt ECF transporter T component CbiQ [Actinophytocola algeriensis]|uniref:Cobalt/nickel transport system permease protein n=1 Tax=Actinophytocola algeriensis TaxID=1768010 RepID=A0A7W7QAU4_9PSEU|nr:cobalt ECF transporter T component CbiQ [Actinophytocola algeriensis]MBB4910165.1 cobalt/nickel transport system permease protein [Actinophytocola algeriensis]MBE1480847.1 cobalt/nickel transport system permease protein [Actinophytocola algeriensis]